MTSLSTKGPVYKQKSHGIEVSGWKREHEDKAFYTVSAGRSYRDSDGNWKTSNSFNLEDRDTLINYLDRAFKDAQAQLDADLEQRRLEDAASGHREGCPQEGPPMPRINQRCAEGAFLHLDRTCRTYISCLINRTYGFH